MDRFLYKEESYAIIGAMFAVHKELGVAFLKEFIKIRWNMSFRNVAFHTKERKRFV